MSACCIVSDPPLTSEMPPQSPATGELASPSPLVSPPTESSLRLVNTTGSAAGPLTTKDPDPDNSGDGAEQHAGEIDFTTVPAGTVIVVPAGICNGWPLRPSGSP